MRWRRAIVLLGLSATAPALAAQGAPPETLRPQLPLARAILAELVQVNTTPSTGNTTPAVEALAARFRAGGFPATDVLVLGAGARNRNLVVRWRGRDGGRDAARTPILFLAHLDVVEAERSAWQTDPFVLTERDGVLRGRGVIDDKGPAAALAAAFLDLRRRGVTPERDLVLALTAGEESGEDNGVRWLLANHPELLRAEFVVNADGGGGEMQDGRRVAFGVQSAEKVYMDLTLTVRGPGGHSSLPTPPSPVDRLAGAVDRLARLQFPENINPVVREYLARRSTLAGGAPSPVVLNALTHTTCITTLLAAGTAANAIPASAQATVNCRIIPGEDADSVVATLRRVIADSLVAVDVIIPAVPSPPSILPGSLERALDAALRDVYEPLPLIPYMEMGATDGVLLRNAGTPVFGIIGLFAPDAMLQSIHGNDERVPAADYDAMVEFTLRLVARLARPGTPSPLTAPRTPP